MPKLTCSVKAIYPRWYMASVRLDGKQAIGFGVSHYKAFLDALTSAQKAKY